MRPLALALVLAAGAALQTEPARAQEAQPALAPDARIEIAPTPPEGKPTPTAVDYDVPPPPRPRGRGLVVDATAGVLGFAGQFRHVAPPAYWLHARLGFEALSWLMIFAEGELAFTDTSESQEESHTVAFPLGGFGGGLRATVPATDRLSPFVEGDAGALTAVVPHGTLAVLGFRQAENYGLQFGGRVGIDWHQLDRHLALTASAGTRIAQGFARSFPAGDLPLMWDAGLGLRYAF